MLWFYLMILGGVGGLGAVYWLWKRHQDAQLKEAATYEWAAFQKNDPQFVAHLNEEQFTKIFLHTHFPRYPTYWFLCVATFLLTLPITFALLYFGGWVSVRLGLVPQTADFANQFLIDGNSMRLITFAPTETAMIYAENLSGFYYFFGVLGAWLLIVTIYLRHYHKTRPGYLRDEIIRAR